MWLVSIWLAGCRSFHACCRYYGVKFKSPDSQFLGSFRVSEEFSGDYAWMLILLYYKDSASQYHLVTPYTRHQLHPVRTTDSVYTTYPVSIENNSVDTPYSQSRTNPKTASGLASSALLESETAYAYPKTDRSHTSRPGIFISRLDKLEFWAD